MTEHTPTLPEQLPLGYCRTTLAGALMRARKAISQANREAFICLMCDCLDVSHWQQLREWVQEAMERNAIRTDGNGFNLNQAPDWIVGAGTDDSALACNQRRVYFLDRLIHALELSDAQTPQA